jgi:hypothetical protein
MKNVRLRQESMKNYFILERKTIPKIEKEKKQHKTRTQRQKKQTIYIALCRRIRASICYIKREKENNLI